MKKPIIGMVVYLKGHGTHWPMVIADVQMNPNGTYAISTRWIDAKGTIHSASFWWDMLDPTP
jgi:hypothetical protein